MARVPKQNQEAINYFGNRLTAWEDNLAAIGLTPAQFSAISAYVSDAQAALGAAEKARQDSKNATILLRVAMESLRASGASCIRSIGVKAEAAAVPEQVYTLASIEPPAPPETIPPPEQPDAFTFRLQPSGALELSFKSKSAGGRPYWTIMRRIDGGTYTTLGTTATRKYLDSTLPSGAGQVSYLAQGFVGSTGGETSVAQTVQFGVGGGGGARSATYNGKPVEMGREAAA